MESQEKERALKLTPKKDLYLHFQDLPLIHPKFKGEEPIAEQIGPPPEETGISFEKTFYGRTISTYPVNSLTKQREGDPICDAFGFQKFPGGGAVLVVADGCNWGEKPREAARRARNCFLNYMKMRRHKFATSRDVGHYLLRAFNKAQEAIVQGKSPEDEAGTTTLLGGIVMPVDMSRFHHNKKKKEKRLSNLKMKDRDKEKKDLSILTEKKGRRSRKDVDNKQRWIFMCASVGDCRAFVCNLLERSFEDIAHKPQNCYFSDSHATEKRNHNDPGGRLGGYISSNPDLRNLQVFGTEVKENDIIMLVSDGVSDNLDARHLGLLPQDVKGLEEYGDDWDKLPSDPKTTKMGWNWLRDNLFKNILKDNYSQKEDKLQCLVERLLQHAEATTSSSRKFMQENPHKRLPKDYRTYQGKMDHTTCVCYQMPLEHFELSRTPLSPSSVPILMPSSSSSSSSASASALKKVNRTTDRGIWCPLWKDVPLNSLMDMFGREVGIRRVPVVDQDGSVIGIVSQSALVKTISEHFDEKDLQKVMVRDFVKPKSVVCVPESMILVDAFMRILETNVSGAGIVDSDGKLVGNLSGSDLRQTCQSPRDMLETMNGTVAQLKKRQSEGHPSRPAVVSCTENDSAAEVVARMNKSQVHRIFVVNSENKPIGIISFSDVVTFLSNALHSTQKLS